MEVKVIKDNADDGPLRSSDWCGHVQIARVGAGVVWRCYCARGAGQSATRNASGSAGRIDCCPADLKSFVCSRSVTVELYEDPVMTDCIPQNTSVPDQDLLVELT